jgi:hypothetical protein
MPGAIGRKRARIAGPRPSAGRRSDRRRSRRPATGRRPRPRPGPAPAPAGRASRRAGRAGGVHAHQDGSCQASQNESAGRHRQGVVDGGEDQAVGGQMLGASGLRRPRASGRPAGPSARPAATGRAAIRPAAHGQAAALAGGQTADLQVEQGFRPKRFGRRRGRYPGLAQPVALEAQLFARRAAGLQPVLMTEQMGFARRASRSSSDCRRRRGRRWFRRPAATGRRRFAAGWSCPRRCAHHGTAPRRRQGSGHPGKQRAFAPRDRQFLNENNDGSQHAKTPRADMDVRRRWNLLNEASRVWTHGRCAMSGL